jgi:hypothetical protein
MHHLPGQSDGLSNLRANFEGKEAIYVEKGALLVRVSDIRSSGLRPTVAAQIDELPAPGLGVGGFDPSRLNRPRPLRWTIRAGVLSDFSDHCWKMGYGGWSLYFEPRLVQATLKLASEFPADLDTFERYRRVAHFLRQDQTARHATWQPVFTDY